MFCTLVKGQCIGKECTSFHDVLTVEVKNCKKFATNVFGSENQDIINLFDIPMLFTIEVDHCVHFGVFLEENYEDVYKKFIEAEVIEHD